MNSKAFEEQIIFYDFVSKQHIRDPMIDIEMTATHGYLQLKELFSARHLRARLRGLHAYRRQIFSRLRSFLGGLIYLR